MGKTPRKIDPVIARQMRAEGATYLQIADRFDASVTAAFRALNRDRGAEYARRYYAKSPERQREANRRYREKKAIAAQS